MFELLSVWALGTGILRALRLRHRAALALAAVAAYLVAADWLGVLYAQAPGNVLTFLNTVFLGPGSGFARAASPLPLPALFLQRPLWLRLTRCVCCWLAAFLCFRESSRLNPLVPRAYALDKLAQALLGAGIVDAAVAGVLWWAELMVAHDDGWLQAP